MKVGVYVDAENIFHSGGKNMWYPALKDFCTRGHQAIRLNTYVSYDQKRAEVDLPYATSRNRFFDNVRFFGFKVIVKESRYFKDDEGNDVRKANADLDLAVDLLTQARNLDIIYLLSGDGDFVRMVQAVQNMGIRVHVIGMKNVARSLVHEADNFTSGFIIPNLLAIEDQLPGDWGALGKKARGVLIQPNQGFGFVEMMTPSQEKLQLFMHFTEIQNSHTTPRAGDVYQFTVERGDKGFVAKAAMKMN